MRGTRVLGRRSIACGAQCEVIDAKVIRRWLKKAKSDVFDSNVFFKKLREKT